MTEYDYSPEAYAQMQRTQSRIAHWVDDTGHAAPHFASPFVPRSDVHDNAFYNPRTASPSPASSRSPPPRRPPQRSYSHGYPQPPARESPLRSASVAPHDSVSQVGAAQPQRPAYRSHRSHSHSPTRHSSGHRSRHHSSGGGYVLSPGGTPPHSTPRDTLSNTASRSLCSMGTPSSSRSRSPRRTSSSPGTARCRSSTPNRSPNTPPCPSPTRRSCSASLVARAGSMDGVGASVIRGVAPRGRGGSATHIPRAEGRAFRRGRGAMTAGGRRGG
ncbi:hypothetical protein DFH09DRAFT_1371267, partial [Mycena vulgaris]